MDEERFPFLGYGENFSELMKRAAAKIADMDKVDGGMGALPLDSHLRTAMTAIATGINTQDWDCVAEGLHMVQHAELRLRMFDREVESESKF